MNKKVILIDINQLRNHEEVNNERLMNLLAQIKRDGYLKNPVVAEDKHLVILDGHHRVAALKKLRAEKIPVFLVTYCDKNVRVFLRRKMLSKNKIKEAVISYALQNKLFPEKTTRHLIKNRPRNINIKLNKLFKNSV